MEHRAPLWGFGFSLGVSRSGLLRLFVLPGRAAPRWEPVPSGSRVCRGGCRLEVSWARSGAVPGLCSSPRAAGERSRQLWQGWRAALPAACAWRPSWADGANNPSS